VSNVTGSVQSDHLVHGHMLPVVVAIGQWPHPPRSAATQPTSQQTAVSSGSHPGWALGTRVPASCSDAVVHRIKVGTVGWPHVRLDELQCLAVEKLVCVTSVMCQCIVLL